MRMASISRRPRDAAVATPICTPLWSAIPCTTSARSFRKVMEFPTNSILGDVVLIAWISAKCASVIFGWRFGVLCGRKTAVYPAPAAASVTPAPRKTRRFIWDRNAIASAAKGSGPKADYCGRQHAAFRRSSATAPKFACCPSMHMNILASFN